MTKEYGAFDFMDNHIFPNNLALLYTVNVE